MFITGQIPHDVNTEKMTSLEEDHHLHHHHHRDKDDFSPISRKHGSMTDDMKSPAPTNHQGNSPHTNNNKPSMDAKPEPAIDPSINHMSSQPNGLSESIKYSDAYSQHMGGLPMGGHHMNGHNFNHPFSINNLMSSQEAAAMMESKMYGHMHGYSPYGQMQGVGVAPHHREGGDGGGGVDDGFYRSYTPQSTANM